MIPTLTMLPGYSSVKKAAVLALSIIFTLISLPIIALLSVTNIAALGWGNGGSSPYSGVYIFSDPISKDDGYDYGYCTYWVALRRIQIDEQIPNNWGNAVTWADNAALDGYRVDHEPSFGAIMQDPIAPGSGGLGHVAFVESVNPDTGAWTISEMNATGWDEVDLRSFPASATLSYNFIHERLLLWKISNL